MINTIQLLELLKLQDLITQSKPVKITDSVSKIQNPICVLKVFLELLSLYVSFLVFFKTFKKMPLFLFQFIDLKAKNCSKNMSRIMLPKSTGQRNWELNPSSFCQFSGSNSDIFQGHQQRKSCIITSHMSDRLSMGKALPKVFESATIQ